MGDEQYYSPVLCSVCGEHATRYIGKAGILPICDNIVCYETRIEEVNKLLKELNNEENEVEVVIEDAKL